MVIRLVYATADDDDEGEEKEEDGGGGGWYFIEALCINLTFRSTFCLSLSIIILPNGLLSCTDPGPPGWPDGSTLTTADILQ